MDTLRRKIVFALPLAVPLAVPRSAGADPAVVSPASGMSGANFSVVGSVKNALDRSPESLRKSELVRELAPIALTSCTGEFKRMLAGYRGLKLTDLLDQAQFDARSHNDLKRMYVLAKAKDGYSVVFSWTELYNPPVGQSVFVLVDKDGTQLPEAEGPLVLVSASDLRTGPRHVRWLTSLEVARA
jgi:hypothetical protein